VWASEGAISGLTQVQRVNAIYIGTPHTFHHTNAKAALLAGKHVLCEKPITMDVQELDELVALAKEKKLFFME
jgi:predicted dehydrogenase